MPTRLEKLKQFLKEAEQHPTKNKLYIEDLLISIKYEQSKPAEYQIIMEEENDLEEPSTV